jgi:hypothetical protein
MTASAKQIEAILGFRRCAISSVMARARVCGEVYWPVAGEQGSLVERRQRECR